MTDRYISTHANSYPRWHGGAHIKHIAGTGNWTLCGRKLSDPFRVSSESQHVLCAHCSKKAYWLPHRED